MNSNYIDLKQKYSILTLNWAVFYLSIYNRMIHLIIESNHVTNENVHDRKSTTAVLQLRLQNKQGTCTSMKDK